MKRWPAFVQWSVDLSILAGLTIVLGTLAQCSGITS